MAPFQRMTVAATWLVWFSHIQASTVSGQVIFKLEEEDAKTWLSLPSKLNACPTSPGAKVAPPSSVPELPPTRSLAVPSPGHQLTRQDCAGRQRCTVMVWLQVLLFPD